MGQEIELLRATRGTLQETSGGSVGAPIGRDGEEFQFAHLARNKVTAAAVSVSDDDLGAIKDFIIKVVL